MDHISSIPRPPTLLRFALAAAIVGAFSLYVAWPSLPAGVVIAYHAGVFLPGAVLAVVVGFLAWSWKWFGITLVVCTLAMLALRIWF